MQALYHSFYTEGISATTLTDGELRALICAAEASVARDPVQGWRDVAIVRVLADAGLRCEELLGLERRDFLPKRKGEAARAADPPRQGQPPPGAGGATMPAGIRY